MKRFVIKYVVIVFVLALVVHYGKNTINNQDPGGFDYSAADCPEQILELNSERIITRSWKNSFESDFCLEFSIFEKSTSFSNQQQRKIPP